MWCRPWSCWCSATMTHRKPWNVYRWIYAHSQVGLCFVLFQSCTSQFLCLPITLFTILGRLIDRVDLIKAGLKCLSVRVCVGAYVCACIHPPVNKSFFDFNEIWHVGRGQWVMHDGMQYDLIQGQVHEPFKVGNPVIFNILIFGLVFVSCDFEVDRNVICEELTVSPIRG